MTAQTSAPAARRTAPPAGTRTTLEIDWTRCDGHGLCAAVLPERFELDEWGFPVIRDPVVHDDDLPDVQHVVSVCPALALRLTHR